MEGHCEFLVKCCELVTNNAKNQKHNLKIGITRVVWSSGVDIFSLQLTGLLLKKKRGCAVDKKCEKCIYIYIYEQKQDSKILKLQKNKEN
jgi:hypothetical protein